MKLFNLPKHTEAMVLRSGATIVALALVAYCNAFPGSFILDDHAIVGSNPLVADFDLLSILRTDYWGPNLNSGLYRPLTIFSLALNQALFGPAPWGFHLVNLLLHASVALLVFVALRRWAFPDAVALLAAAIFAVHPLHSEVINEVVGRSELLAALLVLAALIFARTATRKGNILVGLSFFLALLAKEHAITLIAILPLFDAFTEKSWQVWRKRWPLYAALAAIAVLWLAWKTFGVLHGGRPEIPHPLFVPLFYLGGFERVLAALQLQWLYLGKLLLPLHQQAVYSGENFFTPRLFAITPASSIALLGTATAIGLCTCGIKRWHVLAFAFLLYLVAILPTANLLFPISVNFAERLMYFPSVWFSVFIASTLAWALRRGNDPRAFRLTGGVYVALLLGLCLARNPAFTDEIRLWRTEVRSDPQNVVAWFYLAESLNRRGEQVASEEAFRQMLMLAPDFSFELNRTAVNLIARGRAREGIGLALQSLRDPENDVAATTMILADGYMQIRDFANALHWLEQLPPPEQSTDEYWELRGKAYQGLGHHDQAVSAYERVREWGPTPNGQLAFGLSLFALGREDEAERWLRKGLAEQDDADGWHALGIILAQKERTSEAVDAFSRAVKLAPQNSSYRADLDKLLQER